MIVVRNVFRCKSGKATELAGRFQKMIPLAQQAGLGKGRVMVDLVSTFWTVVFEMETADLASYEQSFNERSSTPEMRDAMGNYMELVEGGHREVFKLVD